MCADCIHLYAVRHGFAAAREEGTTAAIVPAEAGVNGDGSILRKYDLRTAPHWSPGCERRAFQCDEEAPGHCTEAEAHSALTIWAVLRRLPLGGARTTAAGGSWQGPVARGFAVAVMTAMHTLTTAAEATARCASAPAGLPSPGSIGFFPGARDDGRPYLSVAQAERRTLAGQSG